MEHEPEQADNDHKTDYKNLSNASEETKYSSLSNEGTGPEQSKESPKSPPANDDAKSANASPARSSPEPSCAICLGPLQNKSFIDSCFHTFCFQCLVSWSKIKPECPLCKQKFKSIVHNVRSIEDYDQYHIVSRSTESSWENPDGRRFRYSSTLTAERVLERRQHVLMEDVSHLSEYQRHRLTYAPHSVSRTAFSSTRDVAPSSAPPRNFRQQVYDDRLWVVPHARNSRIRCASSEFYRQNPACTHRLIPWLNRELLALLHNSETRVMFVMDLVLALIMRFDIKSQEFHIHMQPYLGNRTTHFVHEFFNYASSPYDMAEYDSTVMYEQRDNDSTESNDEFELSSFLCSNYQDSYDTIVLSSPGSDVIPLPSNNTSVPTTTAAASTSSSTSASRPCKKKKRGAKQQGKRVRKIYLKRNQENNSWNVAMLSASQNNNNEECSNINWQSDLEPGPSTACHDYSGPSTSSELMMIQVDSSGGEDDCVIVDVVKPRNQRTPEIVDLITSSEDESASPLQVLNTDNGGNDGVSLLLQASEVCDEAVSSSAAQPPSDPVPDNSFVVCPLDLSTKSENSCYFVPITSEVEDSNNRIYSYLSSQTNPENTEPHWYSDSTDISEYNTDDAGSSEKQSVRKRLRSVVSSVSSDSRNPRSSSSSHHSASRKKHKHKKKKHVKHKKRRHRSHSTDKED